MAVPRSPHAQVEPHAQVPHAQVDEFFLPELPRLLPYAYHPQAAQIETASNGWIRRLLGATFADEPALLFFLRQRNGIYGPLTVPLAQYQRALDIADWYQYVTVIDSFVSDREALGASAEAAREVFARIVADFDTDVPPNEAFPYGEAGQDLWRRISPHLSPEQVRRLVASLEAFLRGCATEIHAKLVDEVPDYETCLTVRLDSFGCDFIELLTEYGAEVDMTELIPQLTEVHLHCRRQMIIINDLLSWRKEHAQDDKMTVVRVLTEGEGLSLQQAVDRLCGLVEHHEKAYIAARDELLAVLAPSNVDSNLGWNVINRFGQASVDDEAQRAAWPATLAKFGCNVRFLGPKLKALEAALDFRDQLGADRIEGLARRTGCAPFRGACGGASASPASSARAAERTPPGRRRRSRGDPGRSRARRRSRPAYQLPQGALPRILAPLAVPCAGVVACLCSDSYSFCL